MNLVIKTGLLIFTTIAIGLVGISAVSMVDDVFAEIDKEVKNSNIDKNIAITISLKKDNTEKCDPIVDPRC